MFTFLFSNGSALTLNLHSLCSIYWKTKSVRVRLTNGETTEFAHKPEFDPQGNSFCTNYVEFLDFIAGSIDIPDTHRV